MNTTPLSPNFLSPARITLDTGGLYPVTYLGVVTDLHLTEGGGEFADAEYEGEPYLVRFTGTDGDGVTEWRG